MTWDANSLFDLYGPVGRNRSLVPFIPRALVLFDRLRRYAQATGKFGIGASAAGRFSDRVHSGQNRTSGSDLQSGTGTDSSARPAHSVSMRQETEQERIAFGKRLESAMDAKNYPPLQKGRADKLAGEMDVTPKTASNWLHGTKLPQIDRIMELARRLDVSFEWLATGRGPRHVISREESEHIEKLRQLSANDRDKVMAITQVFRGAPESSDGDAA